jgi:hypothetical protein
MVFCFKMNHHLFLGGPPESSHSRCLNSPFAVRDSPNDQPHQEQTLWCGFFQDAPCE